MKSDRARLDIHDYLILFLIQYFCQIVHNNKSVINTTAPQQIHNVNTTLHNVVFLQRCEKDMTATL